MELHTLVSNSNHPSSNGVSTALQDDLDLSTDEESKKSSSETSVLKRKNDAASVNSKKPQLGSNGKSNYSTPKEMEEAKNNHSGDYSVGKYEEEEEMEIVSQIPPITSTTALSVLESPHEQCQCYLQSIEEEVVVNEGQEDYVCGLWSLRPEWLQPFANKKAFLAVFCLTSVLQGMYYTYFVSVLTTIEKLYQIQSKTTGIIMSATEIGQIGGALLLTYYGGHGHRPRWIACGMLVFAFASILCSTPHFFFGGEILLPATVRAGHHNATLIDLKSKLCYPTEIFDNRLKDRNSHIYGRFNSTDIFSANSSVEDFGETLVVNNKPGADALWSRSACDSPELSNQQSRITHMVLAVFFVSLLFIGIGATAVYTLGIPYIDDNVATRESPLYFGITIGVRIFGPVFGFLLGSFCTGVYVNFPFEVPIGITTDDPQWIGAWWLGVFIVGAALILTSVPMMAFPKKLKNIPESPSYSCSGGHLDLRNSQKHAQESYHFEHSECSKRKIDCTCQAQHEALLSKPGHDELGQIMGNGFHSERNQLSDSPKTIKHMRGVKKPILKDFPSAMRRLLKNDILLCRTASSVLHILPIAGLYTFLPKYLESQFQLTATKANMIAGMAGILVMGAGIFASGIFMRKVKPNARFVARWIALAALAYALGMVLLMWLGCPMNNYVGLDGTSGPLNPMGESCNASCQCREGEFAPICTSKGVTYLSPCLAGCTKVAGSPTEQYLYTECLCLDGSTTAINGYCPLQCDNLVWYTIIFSLFVLIHSTSEVGSMLLTLRCVDPEDKAMALGLISFAIGLFGNVPCPIIYGAIVDSACLFWEDNCGEPGACRIYDPDRFRIVFHGVTALIMMAAFVVDAIIWYKSSNIQFHEDGEMDEAEGDHINEKDCTQFESSV